VYVEVGDKIEAGQLIGMSDNNGYSAGNHLAGNGRRHPLLGLIGPIEANSFSERRAERCDDDALQIAGEAHLILRRAVSPVAVVVTARLADGRGAKITIVNHPIGGPVFAGAQVQPWVCQAGATDAQCDQPTVVSYEYKDATSGSFEVYDPKNPLIVPVAEIKNTGIGKLYPYVDYVGALPQADGYVEDCDAQTKAVNALPTLSEPEQYANYLAAIKQHPEPHHEGAQR